jgi:nucleotide-binding universal stress UspA family protein
MALKNILVQFEATEAGRRRLQVACMLARQNDAHLTGIFVVDPLAMGSQLYADDLGLMRLTEQFVTEARAAGATAEAEFRAMIAKAAITAHWENLEGSAAELLTARARCMDLTVLGQTDPDNPAPTASGVTLEQVVFGSGRPVLMVPYVGEFPTIGTNVLVGWTPRRESARAAHDALSLIVPGAAVCLATIVDHPHDIAQRGHLTKDITTHFLRHGMKATAQELVSGGIEPADVLLNVAADSSADLLVIGAYGHSRLSEFVMGGVTRSLLRQATLPILMSH